MGIEWTKIKKGLKLTKVERAMNQMACDVYNYPSGRKKSVGKEICEKSQKLADDYLSQILSSSVDLRSLMINMAAIEMIRALLKKAIPIPLGRQAMDAIKLLEEKYNGDAWMGMHQDLMELDLEHLFYELAVNYENGEEEPIV